MCNQESAEVSDIYLGLRSVVVEFRGGGRLSVGVEGRQSLCGGRGGVVVGVEGRQSLR